MNKLIDVYGKLLTNHQLEILDEYYAQDYSLAEIAENRKISRNAVFSLIKKCGVILEDYETKLCLLAKQENIERLTSDLENLDSKELIKRLNKIAKINER